MTRAMGWGAVAVIAALAAAGCGGAQLTPPTTPTPTAQVEVFSGTLARNGAATHPFTSQAGGTVTATLVTVTPEVTIGFSLGTWNGQSCQAIISNDAAVRATSITGTVSGVGNLCARIYDVGQFTAPTSYEISVVHP